MADSTNARDDRALENQISALVELFRREASENLAALQRAAEIVRNSAGPDLAPVLAEIAATAHKLAGRGGTFGFPAVSDSAKRLETFVIPFARQGVALSDADEDQLVARLDHLEHELKPVLATPPG